MPDSALYRTLAIQLLQTGTFGRERGVPDEALPPGYPFFVAGIFAVAGSGNLGAVRVAQCLLGAVALLPLFALARKTHPHDVRVAKVATLAVAAHPVLVLWPGFVLTETLYTFVSLVFLWLLLLSLERFTALRAAAAGLAFGASLLVREVLLGFALVVAAAAVWRCGSLRRLAGYVAAFALGALLLLGPWAFRNLESTGRLALVTERTASFLSSGGARVTPDARRQRSAVARARYADYHEMTRLRSLLSNPTGYLWTLLVRLEFTWLHPNGLRSLPNGGLRWLYRLAHALVLLLAGVGILEALRSRRWPCWVLTGVCVYSALVHLFLSTAVPRYSIPLLPLILLFASAGMLQLWDRVATAR